MNKRTLYKRMLVGALTLTVAATMVYGITRRPDLARAATPDPTPLNNATGDTICVVNSTQCLDLQGDKFVAGNPIVYYGIDPTEERFRWHLALTPDGHVTYNATTHMGTPFTDGSFDQYYQGDPIYYIEKSTLTGHDGCIGTDSAPLAVEWQLCGSPTTKWVRHNQYFVNVGWTNDRSQKFVLSAFLNPYAGICNDGDGVQAVIDVSGGVESCNVQFDVGLHEG
jgi:hypothetical protein